MVKLSISPLVDQFLNTLQVRESELKERKGQVTNSVHQEFLNMARKDKMYIPVGHIRLNTTKHVHCSLVHFQKYTIEDLHLHIQNQNNYFLIMVTQIRKAQVFLMEANITNSQLSKEH